MLNGQVDEAIFRYERTLAINPSHAPAFSRFALIDRRRLFAKSLAKLKDVVRLSPNDWNIGYWYSLRGRIHFEMGEDAELSIGYAMECLSLPIDRRFAPRSRAFMPRPASPSAHGNSPTKPAGLRLRPNTKRSGIISFPASPNRMSPSA